MKFRNVALMLFSGVIAVAGLLSYGGALAVPPPTSGAFAQGQLFDPVYAVMDGAPLDMGCRGCHIAKQRTGFAPWWGNDRDTVLATLESGITPDGEVLDPPPVDGGRSGILGQYLHYGYMPLAGEAWTQDQLDILDAWLITYE